MLLRMVRLLIYRVSQKQGPETGKCRPGASRKVPPHQNVPPRPQRAMAIPVLLSLLMVYCRHKGPYHADTN